MSADPAVMAAERVCWSDAFLTYGPMTDAAREALRPVREHIEKIPPGLDATALYDELEFIYQQLLGGHCEECRDG